MTQQTYLPLILKKLPESLNSLSFLHERVHFRPTDLDKRRSGVRSYRMINDFI